MDKKDRLLRLIELFADGNKSEFARMIGVTPQAISTWISRNTFDIDIIYSKCVNVSPEWLLTGEGDIFKPNKYDSTVEIKPIHHSRSIEKKKETQVVYLYDFEATAGLKTLFDNKRNNIIDTIKIPKLPKCDGAIHIVGDSMYPLLKSGDIILYKEISPFIANIIYGEMYLLSYDIDGEDYVVVKYIRKSEKGDPFITLGSENPNYASRDIDFHRVTAIAIVKASVRINCIV